VRRRAGCWGWGAGVGQLEGNFFRFLSSPSSSYLPLRLRPSLFSPNLFSLSPHVGVKIYRPCPKI
jgi:hypothetical protein